jgi:hypothetical protein
MVFPVRNGNEVGPLFEASLESFLAAVFFGLLSADIDHDNLPRSVFFVNILQNSIEFPFEGLARSSPSGGPDDDDTFRFYQTRVLNELVFAVAVAFLAEKRVLGRVEPGLEGLEVYLGFLSVFDGLEAYGRGLMGILRCLALVSLIILLLVLVLPFPHHVLLLAILHRVLHRQLITRVLSFGREHWQRRVLVLVVLGSLIAKLRIGLIHTVLIDLSLVLLHSLVLVLRVDITLVILEKIRKRVLFYCLGLVLVHIHRLILHLSLHLIRPLIPLVELRLLTLSEASLPHILAVPAALMAVILVLIGHK